jgi:hypothetical protein
MTSGATNIMNIHAGDKVAISWKVTDSEEPIEWYEAKVRKIHRMEGSRYLVCSVEYDDGEIDDSHIFWEQDYGKQWKFVHDNHDYTEDETDDTEDDSDYQESVDSEEIEEDVFSIAIDNLARELSYIRSSVGSISVMYFITLLPVWILMYIKLYESIVASYNK